MYYVHYKTQKIKNLKMRLKLNTKIILLFSSCTDTVLHTIHPGNHSFTASWHHQAYSNNTIKMTSESPHCLTRLCTNYVKTLTPGCPNPTMPIQSKSKTPGNLITVPTVWQGPLYFQVIFVTKFIKQLSGHDTSLTTKDYYS